MPSSESRNFRIGLVQMPCTVDVAANREKAVFLTRQAARQGAQIICLQELYSSLYFCQSEEHRYFELAEPVPGPSTEMFAAVAREHGVVVIVPLFERRAAGVYHNSAAVIDADGTLLGIYRKMHIPDDPLFYEKFYFAPGDLGFRTFDTRFGRIAVLICWDQWYPEAARLAALGGANVLFYPTAIGWHPSEKQEYGERQRDGWRTMMRAHAIANGLYVAAPNRVGVERPVGGDGIEFWGSSFVADPYGRIAREAGVQGDAVITADCDTAVIETVRQHWPFLRDRRIDAFGDLTRRWLD